MPTMFDAATRAKLHRRIDRLMPDAAGRWGRMTAPQMICHLGDQLRVGLGDLSCVYRPGPLRSPVLRWILVFGLPWPKAKIRTAPEMQSTAPGNWTGDLRELQQLIDRFASRDPRGTWAVHPAFGPLSGREWGRLCFKHTDYHLRQFGV